MGVILHFEVAVFFHFDSIRSTVTCSLGFINYLVIAQNKKHSCLFNSFIKHQINELIL